MPENQQPPAKEDLTDEELDQLLVKLFEERGFDFRDYKKVSLRRRIQKRLDDLKINTYPEYGRYLDTHQDEYAKLFETLLINVTEFFRDPEAWKIVEEKLLPDILARKRKGDTIRIWSAGCASGEEPYSIGILVAQALGNAIHDYDVKIYATDIDENALIEARRGVYRLEKLKNASPEQIEKYFTKENAIYKIDRSIRQMVSFGRQDLTSDAPISHLDLLICRNVLIYFNVQLQNKLLFRFNFALNQSGYIFFGKSESTLMGSKLFNVVSQKWRIFKKTLSITELAPAERRTALIEEAMVDKAVTAATKEMKTLDFYHQAIINTMSPALIVLNKNNIVTTWNPAAQEMWMIKSDYALGRNFYEMGMGDRIPGISDAIRDALRDKKAAVLKEKEIINHKGDKRYIDITDVPLIDQNGELQGTIIMMDDVTDDKRLRDELKRSNEELQELNAKLETTNEELESTNEELETTAEELQSTAEELETSNEELQSTNEELETSNEELRSLNEELETTNDELRERTLQFNIINTHNEAIINNIVEGLIVLDKSGLVTTWNPAAAQMWGPGWNDTMGKNFFALHLTRGIIPEDLKQMINQVQDRMVPIKDKEMNYKTPSGDEHTVVVSIIPLTKGVDYLGTLVLCRDVTADIKRYKS
jgi:two-component system, chemotaxis family, CheB/CheR fusion protein